MIKEILLSIIIPTTGNLLNIKSCIDSYLAGSNKTFAKNNIQLVVFLNRLSWYKTDGDIKQLCQSYKNDFRDIVFVESDREILTSEESAFEAANYALGRYVLISGDKRLFTAEGISYLESRLILSEDEGVFMNSFSTINKDSSSISQMIHFREFSHNITYKQFVKKTGINYFPTAFGNFIVKKDYIDNEVWRHLIKECSPHFSHVFMYLATMADVKIHCCSINLTIAVSQKYNQGDISEWVTYSKLARKYLAFPWLGGLLRSSRFLIEKGVVDISFFARMVCVEREMIRPFGQELFNLLVFQLLHNFSRNENFNISRKEYDSVLDFIQLISPGLVVHIIKLRKFNIHRRNLLYIYQLIKISSLASRKEIIYINSVGILEDQVICYHPEGYVLIKLQSDRLDYRDAFYYVDNESVGELWNVNKAISQESNTLNPLKSNTLNPLKSNNYLIFMTRLVSFLKAYLESFNFIFERMLFLRKIRLFVKLHLD